MEIRYYKEHSWILNRDMEFKIYGRSGGKLCIAFAPENGRFYDYENFGMIESLAPWIESGRLQVVTPDSIDAETWNNQSATPDSVSNSRNGGFATLRMNCSDGW